MRLAFYNTFFSLVFLAIPFLGNAQQAKKPLDHSTYDTWRTIHNVKITNDGDWIIYQLQPGMGDPTLKLYNKAGVEQGSYERSKSAAFSWGGDYLVWKITAPLDSVKAMRRRKVKKDDLPKDTLAILALGAKTVEKIPNVKGYRMPEKGSGYLAYLLDPVKLPKDTTKADSVKAKKKAKVNNKENGYTLIVRELASNRQDTFKYVLNYAFSKYNNQLVFQSTGDSTFREGIYRFDCQQHALKPLFRHKGKYSRLLIDEQGVKVAFMADLDTTKHPTRYVGVYYWEPQQDSALLVLDKTNAFVPDNWYINEKDTLYFSENGNKLFFGIEPEPALPDTSLLEEEIVNVEVWNYKDPRLYTQQKIEVQKDKDKAYLSYFNTLNKGFKQLADKEMPYIITADKGNATNAIGHANEQYQQYISWEGFPLHFDFYRVDMATGDHEKIITDLKAYDYDLSPLGNYFYWTDAVDSNWYAYSFKDKKITNLTGKLAVNFTSELNDMPTPPYPYGIAGWTENDQYILIYDRYDIWKVDPTMQNPPVAITQGRAAKVEYRYLKLDPDEKWIDSKRPALFHTYNEDSRDEGYAQITIGKNAKPKQLIEGPFQFSRPVKALDNKQLVYTKQSFKIFPDLQLSDISFKSSKQISNANPQQSEYSWGSGEIVKWTSLDGIELEGMLFKPDNYDPSKTYPMLVNFYERSSTELHRNRYPKPERSTINYSLYVSNGYVVFNPDVVYKEGYPGESCYNSVIPGVTKLIEEGVADKDHIGVQGHSWGGYQVAYLVTRTDMFAAAEAGAPVPNMISAYGGIRWWTGLSRMFQYEHTQSRIGGTLWEYPLRFIDNSPIFFVDKVNTPLLIMHNDADGHVPWYQGIELFVALRRLGKPSWMLNYPGEPHWPLKRQNQVDFDTRMMQFFDHYLKGDPEPKWMKEGIPAVDKETDLGYELED